MVFYGEAVARHSLEMHVIGGTGSAHRTIVENGHLGQLLCQMQHGFEVRQQFLAFVYGRRNGEVRGENREGVYAYKIGVPCRGFPIMGESVFLYAIGAEETRSFLQSFGADIRHDSADASRVEKQFGREAGDSHILDLDPRKCFIIKKCSPVSIELAGEHVRYGFIKFQKF